ncbi:ABC-type proline/glycine betaine transport system permease subunit [Rhizobium leguminosarum]|nr:ABC-type proline/glycine betaine transport system permease subunit [Rhizobium leguminosarum]
MDSSGFTDLFDEWTDSALEWVSDNGEFLFDTIRQVLEGLYDGILWLLQLPPFYLVALIVALIGWRLVNVWFALLSGVALALCFSMGLWPETMSTLALVLTATALALAIGIPIGIAAGFFPALDRFMEPGLDLIQTLPPYIYLLPAIALLGYGPATALIATVIVAVPPAIRLTSLGIRMTPREFIELERRLGSDRRRCSSRFAFPLRCRVSWQGSTRA